jgi:7,8-dihydroneopterin aldolase/epimerase/oxygenase
MHSISLEGAEFFAYHGYHPEERTIGNKYSVDIRVQANLENAAGTDNLDATIDYAVLYQIIRDQMAVSSRLLEHVAGRILDRVYERFPHVQSAEVSISKYNPPVGGVCYRSVVTLKR